MTETQTTAWLTKCRNHHTVRWTDAQRTDAMAPWGSAAKYGATACPACNVSVRFTPLRGRVSDRDCGPKCTSAMGPSCDCKCGGKNHAADHAA